MSHIGLVMNTNTNTDTDRSTAFFKANWGDCFKEAKDILGDDYTYDGVSSLQYRIYMDRYQSTFKSESYYEQQLDETDKSYAKQHGLTFEDMFYFKTDMCIEAETERLNKIENAIRDAYPIVD